MEVNRQGIEEKGRSLMEMLGNLVIMGILSIGALVAYNYAMNGLRANTILYEINKRAHTCVTQTNLMGRSDCSLSEYGDTIDGKYLTRVMRMDNGFFGIQVGEISAPVCRQIQSKGLKIASQILPENCEETTVTFIFNYNLDGTTDGLPVRCESGEVCGDCEQCGASGFCESICTGGAKCAADFERPNAAKSCCPASKLVGGVCCANPDGNGNCCDSSGKNCCPPNKPIMGKNGTCYGCDENVKMEVDGRIQKCSRCSNRSYQDATYNNIGWCLPKECPADKPVMSFFGICYPCNYSSAIDQGDNVRPAILRTDTCMACHDNRSLYNRRFCSLGCPDPNATIEDGTCICPTNKPLMDKDGKCHSCSDNAILEMGAGMGFSCQSICNGENGNEIRSLYDPQGNYKSYCIKGTSQPCNEGLFYIGPNWPTLACRSCTDSSDWLALMTLRGQPVVDCENDCPGRRYLDGIYCKKCPTQGTNAWNALSASQRLKCGG